MRILPRIHRRRDDRRSRARSDRWNWNWLAAFLLLGCPTHPARAEETSPQGQPARFRLVFSSRMFTDVHENDAKAAVKAWAETLARERHIKAEPDPQVIEGLPALGRALESGQLDLIMLTADEYLDLRANPEQSTLITGLVGHEYRVEYLLLVHRDSGIQDLAGLKGRTVLMYDNSRTCLAPPWLDTILLEKGLPPASEHFASVNEVKKLSGVVLPVFFRQADACVVTRNGLSTLSELNPQVGSQLRVLAASPGLVPSLAYVRTRLDESLGIDLLKEVTSLDMTEPGRQLLSLFQIDGLTEIAASEIDGARELLATHRRLEAKWRSGTARSGAATPGRTGGTATRTSATAAGGTGR